MLNSVSLQCDETFGVLSKRIKLNFVGLNVFVNVIIFQGEGELYYLRVRMYLILTILVIG